MDVHLSFHRLGKGRCDYTDHHWLPTGLEMWRRVLCGVPAHRGRRCWSTADRAPHNLKPYNDCRNAIKEASFAQCFIGMVSPVRSHFANALAFISRSNSA